MKLHLLLLVTGISLVFTLPQFQLRAQTAEETPETAPATATKDKSWESAILDFEKKDKIQPPPQNAVVFVGSSSIRKWVKLAEDFPEIPVINRGFGGSQVKDSVKYADRIVIPYHPRVVVFYAGGNDINAKMTAPEVQEQYKAFDEKVLAALPDVKVIHISLNPTIARAAQDKTVKESNRLLEEYCKGNPRLTYIETYSKIVGANGLAQKDWMLADGIHMNDIGYAHWKDIIKPVILDTYQKAGGTVTPVPAK